MALFSTRLFANGLALGVALLAGSASAQPADVVHARQLLAEARIVAEKDPDRGPSTAMVAEVAGAQAQAGDRQAALATATAIRIYWGWKAAAKSFADGGDLDAALEFAGKIVPEDMFSQGMQINLERDDTLREIALRRAQRRDGKGRSVRSARSASRRWRRAPTRAWPRLRPARATRRRLAERSLSPNSPQASRCPIRSLRCGSHQPTNDIGKVYWRIGDRTAAVAAFDKGLTAARLTPEGGRDCAIAFNAADRAEAGDVAGALRVLQEVLEPRRMPAAVEVARAGRGMVEAGQHDRALEFTAVASDDWRVNAGAKLGGVYLRKGDATRAAHIFERVVAAAEKSHAYMAEEVVGSGAGR
jgi:tetratricopeptide (TPR) repeat protein